jgi:hypothetical protein
MLAGPACFCLHVCAGCPVLRAACTAAATPQTALMMKAAPGCVDAAVGLLDAQLWCAAGQPWWLSTGGAAAPPFCWPTYFGFACWCLWVMTQHFPGPQHLHAHEASLTSPAVVPMMRRPLCEHTCACTHAHCGTCMHGGCDACHVLSVLSTACVFMLA